MDIVVNHEQMMASVINIARFFSRFAALGEHLSLAMGRVGVSATEYSLGGDSTHALLAETGFDSMRQSIESSGFDGLVLTPPCVTFLANTGSGIVNRRGNASEIGGVKNLKGKSKEFVRTEELALQRREVLFNVAKAKEIPALLIVPYGE